LNARGLTISSEAIAAKHFFVGGGKPMSAFAIGGSSADAPDSVPSSRVEGRTSPLGVLALAIWCGLAAGLLEVAANVIKAYTGRDAILRLPHHFVWIIPLANVFLFAGLRVLLALITRLSRNLVYWFNVNEMYGLAR
jgi:hypothetical protein